MAFFLTLWYGKSFGLYTLLYAILGLITSKFSRGFSKESATGCVYIAGVFTAIFELATYIACILIYKYEIQIWYIIKVLILESIYNMILALMLFKPIRWWGEVIEKSKESYYLL